MLLALNFIFLNSFKNHKNSLPANSSNIYLKIVLAPKANEK